ncbi:MAG: hypothetical protein EXS48_00715 [Candidatus Staskawiczbacteria bacterium]|nr:hypothetical protein [Candidatus Staskawiczbacteria bacterium]
MELIRDFKKLNKNDAAIAGGKGASLGEMSQVGLPVPPGFVILSESFEKFLEETDLNVEIDTVLHSVNHKEMHTIENASEKIQALILGADMPKDIENEIQKFFAQLDAKYVAVRSSATAEDSASAAWAGQLDSFLNTSQETLLENVKRCWASLFTPRAIFYRFEKELHKQKISVAVVVQKMIQSEVSGIAFSVHPVTQDRNQLIIEAGLGLGEAIVSGQITPDSYVAEKEPRRIIDKNISLQARGLFKSEKGGNEWRNITREEGEKQTLTDKQILELSEIILHIENHYGFPCDIEWAFEGGKFYIVQSRPITTLAQLSNNLSELDQVLESEGINNKDLWVEQGRWVQSPFAYVMFCYLQTTKIAKELVPGHIFANGFNIDGFEFPLKIEKEVLMRYLKKAYQENTLGQLTQEIDTRMKGVFKDLEDWLGKTDSYIEHHIDEFLDIYKEFSGIWCLAVYAGNLMTQVAKDVGYIKNEADLFAKVHPHLRKTWLEHELADVVAMAKKSLQKDSSLAKDIKNYLEKYRWIAISKWLGEPITEEYAKKRIAEEIINIQQNNYLAPNHEPIEENALDGVIWFSICAAYWRPECGKMEMMIALRLRKMLEKIAEANGITYAQVLLLSPNEFTEVVKDASHKIQNVEKVLQREKEFFSFLTKDNREIILTPKDPQYAKIKARFIPVINRNEHSDTLKGIGASPGKARGKVRIISQAKEFSSFEPGEILVAAETTPSFVPLMRMASAIVTGMGGITSHAAIVGRELKKPCVIAVKDVTRILKTGDEVEVDADNGIVKILK